MSETKLVFIYNADSGLLNALKDGVEKIVSPSTYQCRLCALTFGTATMKSQWRRYINSLEMPVLFFHKNEFNEKYDEPDAEFPSVYIEKNRKLDLFISMDEMNNNETLEELIMMVKVKLGQL